MKICVYHILMLSVVVITLSLIIFFLILDRKEKKEFSEIEKSIDELHETNLKMKTNLEEYQDLLIKSGRLTEEQAKQISDSVYVGGEYGKN